MRRKRQGISPASLLRAVLLVGMALVSTSCARGHTPSVGRAIDHPDSVEQLRRDLRTILASVSADRRSWAVYARSLTHGDLLYGLNLARLAQPDILASVEPQEPTSMSQLAAIRGLDFRFTTRLSATARVSKDGVIRGDLIVDSDGDPTISAQFAERLRVLDVWAARLRALGVRRIDGRLIGDDRHFAGPNEGWTWADVIAGYGAPKGALQFREGLVDIEIAPGLRTGQKARVRLISAGSGLEPDVNVTTVAEDSTPAITVRRIPGSPRLSLLGEIPRGSPAIVRRAAVDDPTDFYLAALRHALAGQGIEVTRGTASIGELRRPLLPVVVTLVEDHSPPLADIISIIERRSTAGLATSPQVLFPPRSSLPPASDDQSSELRGAIEKWGIPAKFLEPPSSPLDRYDHVPVRAYRWLASHAQSTAPPQMFSGSGGSDLYRRLEGTGVESRVWARTAPKGAALRMVTGYLVTADNEPVAFVLVVENFRRSAATLDRALDAVLMRLAVFRR